MSASFDGSFVITNVGSASAGNAHALGRMWRLRYYQAGAGGHDSETNLPLRVDPTLTVLPNPTTGLITFNPGQIAQVDFRKTSIQAIFGKGVGTGPLSSVGIYGEVVAVVDPADEAIIGNTFLFGVCNLGYNLKASNAIRTFNIILNSI